MKKILTLSLALSALVFTATAQEQREIKKERTEGRKGMRGEGMMKDLNLTEAQKAQMKAIREESKAKMEQLKSQNLTEDQRKAQQKIIFAEQKAKMESVLTAEQKAKMAEQRKDFGDRKEGDRKDRDGKFEGKKNDGRQSMMKEKLGLTDDQVARLKAQHESLKARKEAIKNDQTLSKEAKKEKLKALKTEAKEQRKSILTADQLKKMEEFKKGRKDKGSRKARK